jgi:DNA polymerase-3 subunit epsilon
VSFTGATSLPRESLEAIAASAGLSVGGVIKRSAALVAADPNSRSGKAAKAARYGVPVVSEQVFLYAVERISTT